MTRRNLIIVHRGPEYARDFNEIAAKVSKLDRDSTVYHLPATLKAELPSSAWQLPTLTVSLNAQFRLAVRRGPVLRNYAIGKLRQLEIFQKSGIPVPPTLPFSFGMRLDPVLFGEYVVLKPLNLKLTSHGNGVMLFRRRYVESLRPQDLRPEHPLRSFQSEFLVQKYVDAGADVRWHRVSSFFSRPLYSIRSHARKPVIDLQLPDEELSRLDITNVRDTRRIQEFCNDADVLSLAMAVHDALLDVPLLGIDILREQRTGRLFVLEANPGGNTWHFSNPDSFEWRQTIGSFFSNVPSEFAEVGRRMLMSQFRAFDTVAEVLAKLTAERAA